MPDNTTIEWCAGLPFVQQRPFAAEEKESLRRQVQRLRWRGIGALLLFPTLLALLVVLAAIWGDSTSEVAQGILFVFAILLLTVCLPIEILVARDAFRRCKGLTQDLRCEFVKQFAGPPHAQITLDETAQKLKKAGLLPAAEAAEWSLEILPASGRVWRVMDRPVKPWIEAQTIEIAETPEFAGIAAQWLEPIAQTEDKTFSVGQRELSAAEQDELRRYARRLWLRPLPWAAGLTLWFSLLLTLAIFGHRLPAETSNRIRLLLLACLTVVTDYHFATSLLLSRKMRRDAQSGSVTIVRVDANAPLGHEAASSETSGDEAGIVEILPVSGWIWTHNGIPTLWRKVRV